MRSFKIERNERELLGVIWCYVAASFLGRIVMPWGLA